MFDIKHWYESELEAVGYLAAMKDGTLRRRYATKVVEGMKHLIEAIQERMENSRNSDKRLDLTRMAERLNRAREHVKAEYGILEGNLSYGWEGGPLQTSNTMPGFAAAAGVAGLGAAAATLNNSYTSPEMNSLYSGNLLEGETLPLEEGEEEENLYENNLLTGAMPTGNVNALTGNVNALTGNVNTLTGNVNALTGNVNTGATTAPVNPFGINLGFGGTSTTVPAPAPAPGFMNTLLGTGTAAAATSTPSVANNTAPSFMNTLLGTGTAAPAPAAANQTGGRRRRNRKSKTQRKGRKGRKGRGQTRARN